MSVTTPERRVGPGLACVRQTGWPLERVLFAMAATVTLLSAALAALVSPWFLLLTAFVALNQWLYASLGACGASLILGRLFGLRSSLYVDRTSGNDTTGHDVPKELRFR